MKVVEIFTSIQGEGKFLGTPVIFIRLAGCNLNCGFCDTDWSKGQNMTIAEIKSVLDMQKGIKRVVITGGEPTIHKGFEELCMNLKSWGYKVNIETNGTTAANHKYIDWITCSPKEDADYMCDCASDEIKLVVTPTFDINDPRLRHFWESGLDIWLQPEGSQMKEMWNKCAYLAINNPSKNLRVGVQLHKLMEVR